VGYSSCRWNISNRQNYKKGQVMSDDEPEFIYPSNNLKNKVGPITPGIDEAALARAEQAIAGMADNYLEWAAADIDKLAGAYDELRASDETNKAERLDALFNVAHDIKGQGGSFGFPLITAVANQLCRFLENTPSEAFGNPQMDVVNVHINALRLILQQKMKGDGGKAGENLLSGLAAVIDKVAK